MKALSVTALILVSIFLGACQTVCYEGTFYTPENPSHGTWQFQAPENGGAVTGDGVLENVDDDPIPLMLSGEYEPGAPLEVRLDGADGGDGFISFGTVSGQQTIEGDAVYTTASGTLFNGGARGQSCDAD